MVNLFRAVPNFIKSPYSAEEVYAQPQTVDLKAEFQTYDFLLHHAAEKDTVDKVFKQTVTRHSGEVVSASSLLEMTFYTARDHELLEKMGFHQINADPATGIVLQHASLNSWLIKKNYGWLVDENGEKKRIAKAVGARNIPRWMVPSTMRKQPTDKILGIQVANDSINPLRVVMLKRGRDWIRALGLKNLKAAKEYLLLLHGADSAEKPLYEYSVVISKKENVLNARDSMLRFVQLASVNPSKLEDIANQICLFISCNPITDLHLDNMRFLDDNSDTLFFMDGEPIGGIAEASDTKTVEAIEQYDRGFFPILALRNLQSMISIQMDEENIPSSDKDKVKTIFDEAIDRRVQVIIWERNWLWFKSKMFTYTPGLAFISRILTILQTFIRYSLTPASTIEKKIPIEEA